MSAVASPNGYIRIRLRYKAMVAVVLVALTVAAVVLVIFDPSALRVLPALLLPMLVALRRYPGERLLTELSRARQELPRRSRSRVPFAARRAVAMPRGGLLLACSLAVRPPPGQAPAAGN